MTAILVREGTLRPRGRMDERPYAKSGRQSGLTGFMVLCYNAAHIAPFCVQIRLTSLLTPFPPG
jgi:hypothetical protein